MQSAKTVPRADCSLDHKLLIEKFRLKLKKVGITRPFRYDLNQLPYDYTVKVTNRFKGLDLGDRVPEELWTEVHNITGGGGQNHPKGKKKMQEGNWLSEEALPIAKKRREVEDKGEKVRYT